MCTYVCVSVCVFEYRPKYMGVDFDQMYDEGGAYMRSKNAILSRYVCGVGGIVTIFGFWEAFLGFNICLFILVSWR